MLTEQEKLKAIAELRREIMQSREQTETGETLGQERIRRLGLTQKIEEEPVKKEEKSKGFFTTVGESIKKRVGEVAETWKQTAKGKISPAETGLQTIGKGIFGTAGDILGSGLVSILKGISKITPDVIEDPIKKAGVSVLQSPIGQKAITALESGIESYEEWKKGNPRAAKNIESIIDIAAFSPALRGAKLTERAAIATEKVIATTAKPIEKVVSGATKFGVQQVSGLSPETVNTILKNPKGVSSAIKEGITRENIAQTVKYSLEKRIDDLSSTGKEYDIIRELPTNVEMPTNVVDDILQKYGIQFDSTGKISLNRESRALKQGDVKDLQNFINQFRIKPAIKGDGFVLKSPKDTYTANAFLNARQAVDNLMEYDINKSSISEVIGGELRSTFDKYGKKQLPGLEKLDEKFAVERKILGELKKDLLKADGELKDGAYSILGNLTRKGNEQKLKRVEQLQPGITENIKILNALEDIEFAKGQKVGVYMRAPALGAATANVPLVIAGLFAYPGSMKEILIYSGVAMQKVEKIMSELKKGSDAILTGADKAIIANALQESIMRENE